MIVRWNVLVVEDVLIKSTCLLNMTLRIKDDFYLKVVFSLLLVIMELHGVD